VRAGTRTEEVAQQAAQVQQAQANLNNAQTDLTRDQYLLTQGAIPRQQLDLATTQRDVAAAQLQAAQQRLTELHHGSRPQEIATARAQAAQAQQRLNELLAGPRPQEVQEARAQVAQAQGQADAARAALALAIAGSRKEAIAEGEARVQQAQGGQLTARTILSHTSVFAPADGVVTLRAVEPGEIVTVGEPIIRIAELPTVWIRVYVPEPQIGRLKLGQRANVTTDAFPGRVFAGRVTEIAEVPEFTPKNVQTQEERVKLVFGVKVQAENPDQALKPGMPGNALIFVGGDNASPQSSDRSPQPSVLRSTRPFGTIPRAPEN
jgi:HlyD family secretion protein